MRSLSLVCCIAGAAAVAALAGAGTAGALVGPGLAHAATVTLSSNRAGADPVALTLELEYEMQCGYPGPGPVLITLPAAERLPGTLARTSVRVDGRPAVAVSVTGHTVSVGLAPEPRIMCDVIGPGRLTVLFTSAAHLGNPSRPETYVVEATRGGASFSAGFALVAP